MTEYEDAAQIMQDVQDLWHELGLSDELPANSLHEVLVTCISEVRKLRIFAEWYTRHVAAGVFPQPPENATGGNSGAGVMSGSRRAF